MPSNAILTAISSLSARAGYGPIGQVNPEAVMAETRMDRAAFVREIKKLADRGLIEIDEDSGMLQLARGSGEQDDAEPDPDIGTSRQPPATAIKVDPPRTPRPAPGILPLLNQPVAAKPRAPMEPEMAPGPELVKLPRKRPAAKPKRPALPKRAAKAALKQQRDTAIAVKKRRAAKKVAAKAKRR